MTPKGDPQMNFLRKSAFSSAGVAAAVLLLALITPRAARASSATLVHALRSAGAPVTAQAVSVPVSKFVTLTATTVVGATVTFHEVSPSGSANSLLEYGVPADQNLVITSVEISPIQNGATSTPAHVFLAGPSSSFFPLVNVGYGYWLVSNQVMTELQYPTGFVIGAGVFLKMSAEMNCVVTLHGYLSPN
jgi:hypothetical protein